MTGPLSDFIQVKDTWGLHVAIIIFLCIIIAYLLFIHFRSKTHAASTLVGWTKETLKLIRASLELESGQCISLVGLVNTVDELKEKFKQNCDGCADHRKDKTRTAVEMQQLRADVHSLIAEGKERQSIMNSVNNKLDLLVNEIISTLRLGLGLKQKQSGD